MNLAEKLAAKSDDLLATQNKIVKEIVDYFNDYLTNGDFEKRIERWVMTCEDSINTRSSTITVSFWRYADGCSDTYFSIGGKKWNNPESPHKYDSARYLGVCLQDIQNKVCDLLLVMTKNRLMDLGFNIKGVIDKESWLHYYDKQIQFSW